ncbi:PREDICTED: glutathione S-transferase T3-like [Brassica oleracea var. oleracea]|uniref:glutathione S-transferase T3-like n=1 Tax=Brassica oleracea var. oleracea TaxID=109376 RepID=UPI0006A6AB39|nr:PREDICTED: glutathione S-transferase T3-like [Brassica oleracea var. oleracea]
MDSYPSTQTSKFVELLNGQQSIFFGNYEDSSTLSSSQVHFLGTLGSEASNFGGDTAADRREQRKWTPTDDVVLISSWLNTSKDPVVGNEHRSDAFWKRIAAYFAATYEAANREKSSRQNENDVLKLAHQIFYNNRKKKLTLEHAWKELRNDHKWCDLATAKNEGSSKKRKFEDGADSSSSQATENKRPPGVKAAKMSGKKMMAEENALNEF